MSVYSEFFVHNYRFKVVVALDNECSAVCDIKPQRPVVKSV